MTIFTRSYRSAEGGPEDEVGVFGVLLVELVHPLREDICGHHKVLLPSLAIHHRSLHVETHHEVEKVLRHQLRVLLLPVRGPHQQTDLLEGLRLQAELDCLGGLELRLEGEAGGEGIGAPGVGDRSEELHAVVGREGVVEGDCESFGDGRGEEEADVGDGARRGEVGVVDVAGLLKVGDDWLAGHQQREGQACHHFTIAQKQYQSISSRISQLPLETASISMLSSQSFMYRSLLLLLLQLGRVLSDSRMARRNS